MAIKKFNSRGTFTKWEEKQLLKIPQGPTQNADLKAFCKMTGRLYGPVYAEWNSLMKKAGKWDLANSPKPSVAGIKKKVRRIFLRKPAPKSTVLALTSSAGADITPVPVASGNAITPYVLEDNPVIPRGGTKAAFKKLIKTLDPVINAMLPHKHTVPIFKQQKVEMAKYLKKNYKDREFVITGIKDNPDMVRVHRTF
jgi:hypothetical protein